ncbi:MAG: hypothetical protein Q3976_05605 [Corynebacterium sp.]|nr:hypothetical protein [Corynebacterium sp.]
MTNPQQPQDPNSANNRYNRPGSQDDFEPYPSSNHPEDRPDFGQTAPGYNQPGNGYGQAGYGQGYPGNAPGGFPPAGGSPNYDNYGQTAGGAAGVVHSEFDKPFVVSDEGLDIGASIKYGVIATFRRPLVWIVGAIAAMLLLALISLVPVTNLFAPFIMAALGPAVYRVALLQLEDRPFDSGELFSGYAWGRSALVYLVSNAIVSIGATPFFLPMLNELNDQFANSQGEQVVDFGTSTFIFALLGLVIYLILAIFLQFSALFAVDQDTSFGDAIKGSIRLGRTWFFRILLWNIALIFLAFFFTIITLGIGLIIILPVLVNSSVYVYRQMAQRPFPDFKA